MFYSRYKKLNIIFFLPVKCFRLLICYFLLALWRIIPLQAISYSALTGLLTSIERKELSCRSSDPKLLQQQSREEVCQLVWRQNSKSRNTGEIWCSQRKCYGLKVKAFQENQFPSGLSLWWVHDLQRELSVSGQCSMRGPKDDLKTRLTRTSRVLGHGNDMWNTGHVL